MMLLWAVLILLPLLTFFLLGHYDASGFACSFLSYLMKSSENRIDLFLTTTGFRFDSSQLSGALSGTKYFF
jgi:hypothetical protein